MMGVNQLAFFGLFILNYSDPLVSSLTYFGLFNGLIDIVPTTQQNTPNRIYAVGFTQLIIANINVSLFLVILPLIVCLIFYIIHSQSTKYRIRMKKACRLLVGEWFLTAFILILYNYSSSLTGFCIFTS